MNKEMRKKLFALISSYAILLGCIISSCHEDNTVTYNNEYEYSSEDPYAFYRNGKIYICSEDVIKRIRNDKTSDIYIIDGRNDNDPDFRICNSYEIIDPIEIGRIIEVLENYEMEYPSNWDRSKVSMRREWLAHNICYYFNVEKNRTSEVDLNNSDENKYLALIKK